VLVLLSTGAVVVWAAKKDSWPPERSVAPPPTGTVTPTAGATAMSVPEDR
jgi:hypothetical protein